MNTSPVVKLTMVSVTAGHVRLTRFVMALYVDGKPVVPLSVIDSMLRQMRSTSGTYSVG